MSKNPKIIEQLVLQWYNIFAYILLLKNFANYAYIVMRKV